VYVPGVVGGLKLTGKTANSPFWTVAAVLGGTPVPVNVIVIGDGAITISPPGSARRLAATDTSVFVTLNTLNANTILLGEGVVLLTAP